MSLPAAEVKHFDDWLRAGEKEKPIDYEINQTLSSGEAQLIKYSSVCISLIGSRRGFAIGLSGTNHKERISHFTLQIKEET